MAFWHAAAPTPSDNAFANGLARLPNRRLAELGKLKRVLRTVADWHDLMSDMARLVGSWYDDDVAEARKTGVFAGDGDPPFAVFERAVPNAEQFKRYVMTGLLWPGPRLEGCDDAGVQMSHWPLSEDLVNRLHWVDHLVAPIRADGDTIDMMTVALAGCDSYHRQLRSPELRSATEAQRAVFRAIRCCGEVLNAQRATLDRVVAGMRNIPRVCDVIGEFDDLDHLAILVEEHPENQCTASRMRREFEELMNE